MSLPLRTYNPSVRIGNWNEELQLEEDTLKNFMEMRDNGELMIQKTLGFLSAMRKKLQLSVSQDYALHIGDQVLIRCPAPADADSSRRGRCASRKDCVVAVLMTDPSDLIPKALSPPLIVTGSPAVEPNQRTVFSIESVEGGMKGYKVKHGEPFYLCTVSQDIGKLYLTSDRAAFYKCAYKSRHQQVFLMPQPTYLSHWMLLHKNPRLRLEYEHFPVEANEECVLVHCKTNRCLAVEQDFNIYTPFGGEYEISAHTFLDSHKVEKDNNHWILVVGVPGSSVNPVPEQGPGAAPLHPASAQ